MTMRYGAITSLRGTRREIGRMSAAGDQGEAREAWQEVEKRDKASVATMGGRVEGREGSANVISTTSTGSNHDNCPSQSFSLQLCRHLHTVLSHK